MRVNCDCCGNNFNKSPQQIRVTKAIYCSKSCAAKINNKKYPKRRKINKKCKKCDEPIYKSGRTFCSFHTEEWKNRTKFITLDLCQSKESLKNLHISSKNVHTRGLGRTQHKELIKKPCFICGYDKHVELCHIKPISEFPPETLVSEVNDISNVVQLCRNCHWEFDKMKIIKIVK